MSDFSTCPRARGFDCAKDSKMMIILLLSIDIWISPKTWIPTTVIYFKYVRARMVWFVDCFKSRVHIPFYVTAAHPAYSRTRTKER